MRAVCVSSQALPAAMLFAAQAFQMESGPGLRLAQYQILQPARLLRNIEGGSEPRAKNQWSGPSYWTTAPQLREPRSAGQDKKKPKSERGSGCGVQMDLAQTMAEWELQQCA